MGTTLIRVQRDPHKGFRFFDQAMEISRWLNNDDFLEFIKMFMLMVGPFHICTLN